ncbi:MAG: Gfo/Idh/MocA family oxidoreductase [Armatimonadota bacterium]|nr:Gfo/Idh/MocA family oxidoreductase [Armatimonadota bacterium]MCX7778072.1 Gfo/Idh/MocA family oxidoreductase [Armatimonadota bacterium]MDW8025751.1 Gfo/Idh/MocA family oxidoreductase [Armatimonadota bacterium]
MRDEANGRAKKGIVNRRRFVGMVTASALGATMWRKSKVYSLSGAPQLLGANERIGVGLIGCGGRGMHLGRVVRELSHKGVNAQIVAVCDIYRPRLERAAKEFNARAYMDVKELVTDKDVDAVIVATPDRLHVFNSLEAVRAGKDVYCEKPLTHWQQFELLKQLVREVKAKERVFQVGTQWLSDSVWHQAAELIKQGAIGKPLHAQCGYFRHGDWGERGMPIDDPNAKPGPDLNWEAFLADAPKRAFDVSRFFRWRMYMDYAGGPCTDLYPHCLTPVVKALGVAFPKTVVAVGGKYRYDGERDVPDTFDMLIQYPEGITVVVLGTIANEWGIPTLIRGEDATMLFEGHGIVIQPQGAVKKERREIKRERGASDEEHMRNFIECVRTRQKTYSDIDLGYHVQTALIMGMLSFVHSKVATFDPHAETIKLV